MKRTLCLLLGLCLLALPALGLGEQANFKSLGYMVEVPEGYRVIDNLAFEEHDIFPFYFTMQRTDKTRGIGAYGRYIEAYANMDLADQSYEWHAQFAENMGLDMSGMAVDKNGNLMFYVDEGRSIYFFFMVEAVFFQVGITSQKELDAQDITDVYTFMDSLLESLGATEAY